MMSCKIPSGQTEEQYTLPNKKVITKTKMNPAAAKLPNNKNLRRDGMNCKYKG